MAIRKGHPLTNEPIDVRCIHIVGTEGTDRIETLLIGDDEDDVRAIAAIWSGSLEDLAQLRKQRPLEITANLLAVKVNVDEIQQGLVVTRMM